MIRRISYGVAVAMIGAVAAGAQQDNWGYSGANGPSTWAQASPTCAESMQSPVLIEGTEPVAMHELKINYSVSPLAMRNAQHTLRFDYAAGNFMTVGAKIFQLKQFQFRTPAEHQVMNQRQPMEIQFAHQSLSGETAVVSVLVAEGKASLAAEELLPHLPLEAGQSTNLPAVKINARDFMPSDKSYYRYMGSLTTPPCAQGVNWYVLKTPIQFSAEQIALVKGIMGENARPLQRRNNRIILDARPQ